MHFVKKIFIFCLQLTHVDAKKYDVLIELFRGFTHLIQKCLQLAWANPSLMYNIKQTRSVVLEAGIKGRDK